MDDVLRHVIGRRGLTGEDIHARHPLGVRIGLDAVVAGDHMQHVHQLAFVLMNTLDLHIKQRFRVHHHVKLLGDKRRQTLFILQLRTAYRLVHQRVITMLFQLAELAEIGSPGTANVLIQYLRKRRVGQRQPAARRHAVGDVAKTRREDFRKISKQRLHHQIGVQLRHAVYFVADHHRQPRHTHAAAVRLINDRGTSQQAGIVRILLLQRLQEVVVNLKDDLQMARQNFAQHIHRPGFQCFAHQRVVGVREHLAADLKRIVPAKLVLINQQAHQLRDRQHRVGIVEVNGDFIRQVVVGFVQLIMAAQNILDRRGDQEVLLAQTQLAPGIGGVIRIQYAGDVLRVVFIFHRRKVVALVKFTEVDCATGLSIPQAQRIGRVSVVTRDNLVVCHREDLFGLDPAHLLAFHLNTATKAHFVARIVAFELPRVTVFQPVVRRLFLSAINNILLEHAVVVANTVAAARQA